MSKVIDNTTVAQNINATLSTEDTPMNENVTLAQLNAEAKAKVEAKVEDEAKAKVEDEKKEKYSLTRSLKPHIEEIEKKSKGNETEIKKLQTSVKVLMENNLPCEDALKRISFLRENGPSAPTKEDFLRWGEALWTAVTSK